MYFEEKMINGVLCWRDIPDGEWTAYTVESLSVMYDRARRLKDEYYAALQALTLPKRLDESKQLSGRDTRSGV